MRENANSVGFVTFQEVLKTLGIQGSHKSSEKWGHNEVFSKTFLRVKMIRISHYKKQLIT